MAAAEEQMDVDVKPDVKKETRNNKTTTVAEVLNKYARNPNGTLEFYQLVKVWKQLEAWKEEPKVAFISEFFGTSDVFGVRFVELVAAICELRWHHVPAAIRVSFVEFLADIALFNPMHLHLIARACVSNFIPEMERKINEETKQMEAFHKLPVDQLEPIWLLCLAALDKIFPPSSPALPMLVSTLRRFRPHKKCPLEELVNFVRLSMILADWRPQIAGDLWAGVVSCMVQLDAEVSEGLKTQLQDIRQIFPKDDHSVSYAIEAELTYKRKLDAAMLMVLCWTGKGPNPADSPHTKWMADSEHSTDLYPLLSVALDKHILWVQEIDNVSFIWFFLCSQDHETLVRFLQQLWKVVVTPVCNPNEWKRSQNAAALIAGLLARGNFVPFEMAIEWLKRMAEWCTNYVDKAGQVKSVGGLHHSIFYATVQALFFTFCFRYKEFIDAGMVDEVRMWGVGKIVHSQLEPLNYIYKPLALCFASISRYMQIVYCNHILSMTSGREIHAYFPFLHCGLTECQPFIQPLLRAFEPVADDFGTINAVRSRRTTETCTEEAIDLEYSWMDDGIDVSDYM
ncbi:RNA polymerase I specific transcription initiation factor RRN3 [Aphelenchoides fujianensis]|nr:RNA polymerase I specific transcription initiation factor RRN3 [Aphelenchoides fujianensis]